MDETTELRLLLRIAELEGRLSSLYACAYRLVSRVDMPGGVTAKSYSTTDTKRVPARPLATLRNLVRDFGKGESQECETTSKA
jgi:hypothetical protein